MSKTKTIECTGCGAEMQVQKFASNKQLCKNCSSTAGESSKPSTDLADMERPRDKVKLAQAVLDALGFTITSRGYHKDYVEGDASVRIELYWDKGTSMDTDYRLEAIVVTKQQYVPINDRRLNEKIPHVAQPDIHSLMNELGLSVNSGAQAATHIDTTRCSQCGDETPDWIQVGNGKILCLKKCAPAVRPYGRTRSTPMP